MIAHSIASLADLHAVSISGRFVRLEPPTLEHVNELLEIGKDDAFWQFMPGQPLTSIAAVQAQIAAERGRTIPFVIRMLDCNAVVGGVEYASIDPGNESVEVTRMWLDARCRGTLAAPEAVYLLTAHAFDLHGAGRVWMATDSRDKASNVSLRSFGITFEACLRRHLRLHTGFIRDTNIYSITADEWPALRAKWETLLEEHASRRWQRPDRRRSIAELFRTDLPPRPGATA